MSQELLDLLSKGAEGQIDDESVPDDSLLKLLDAAANNKLPIANEKVKVPGGTDIEPSDNSGQSFMSAVKEGFGSEPLGPSAKTKQALESVPGVDIVNRYVTEPAMTAGETAVRAGMGAWAGAGNLLGKGVDAARYIAPPLKNAVGTGEQFARDFQAIPEAFPAATMAKTANAENLANAGKEVGALAKAVKSPAAMTAEQTRAKADVLYKNANMDSVFLKPEVFDKFADHIADSVNDRTTIFGKNIEYPDIKQVLGAVTGGKGKPQSLADLEKFRSYVSRGSYDAFAKGEKSQSALYGLMKDKVTELIDTMPGGPEIDQARDLWKRQAKLNDIQTIVDVGSDINNPNFIRNEFVKIRKNKGKFNSYTPQEKELINKLANVSSLEKAEKLLAPTGTFGTLKLLAGVGIGSAAGLPAAVLPAAGLMAKVAAPASREAQVNKLMDAIARGGEKPPGFLDRYAIERAKIGMTP